MKRRTLSEPSDCKLILALLWNPSETAFEKIIQQVEKEFGAVDDQSDVFQFGSAYYNAEMGEGLVKCFVSISDFLRRDCLPTVKHQSTALEKVLGRSNHTRIVNVDPMILSLENVVIATSKAYSHRIYLGQGVFGDLGLIRKKDQYVALEWTYNDYKENLSFFERVRKVVHGSLMSKQLL